MDLFSYLSSKAEDTEPARNIDLSESIEKKLFSPKGRISNEIIDQILQSGPAGYDHHALYEVFNFYSTHWSVDEWGDKEIDGAVKTIKDSYSGASLGFLIDGKKISIYYDKNEGMLLAYGNECRQHPTEIIPWSDVEERIYDMIEGNRFLDVAEEKIAAQVDEEDVVTTIVYYFQDAFDISNDRLPKLFGKNGYVFPDIIDKVRETIRNQENGRKLLASAKQLWSEYENGEVECHWKYACKSDCIEHLEAYLNGRYEFSLPKQINKLIPAFIPNDAIDQAIHLRGTKESDVLFRRELYATSEEGSNVSAVIEYLKNRFGTGGYGYSGFSTDYTAIKKAYNHETRTF